MKNFEINAGGFIGAIVGGAGALVICVALIPTDEFGRRGAKFVIGGLIAGAVGGNSAWTRFVKGAACPKCGAKLRTEHARQCLKCGASWHGESS